MTRAEHLQWCKDRALGYIESGNVAQAYSSMVSDLAKHPETRNHAAIQLGAMLLVGGQLSTPEKMREFILGFN
jgi:hypothetical protein